MSSSHVLQEHWTDQKSAVVVTAEPAVIGQLIVDLNLPDESPVSVSDNKLALAFWGENLSTYETWRDTLFGSCNGSIKHTKPGGNG